MGNGPDFRINEPLYQWCVRAFSLLRRRVGINIKVHDADGKIEAGQIFLFNHFTRFETIIPQYFIHQATGAYCRCVAAHQLFKGNETFARLLWSCGAVPSNHPGLLAFLAAEILRGRKVIFFPEGRMIKDRHVSDGELNSVSQAARHRQGAAALALVLEIFKRRILSLYELGETARLERWVNALGLKDAEAMIAAARQPTVIIPANITFNPIHTSDNILRKAAELFGRDISEETKAELLIESNLVLRRTDMDIRFGRPIHPEVTWSLLDRFIVNQAFERIQSLEELFALKDNASRWVERLLVMTVRRETHRLRNLCMAEMYARVTINLNHVASRLVLVLLDRGISEIEAGRFHRLLYRAFKNVQKEPGIALHRSLTNFDFYDGIHTGTSPLIAQFREAAVASGLIETSAERYRFLPSLRRQTGDRDPRLQNIVAVYANEVAPVAAACRAIDEAAGMERDEAGAELARLLFDDELRAYAYCKETYSRGQFAAINGLEQASESGEPYLIAAAERKRLGVILVHDFLASPAELRKLGQRIAERGYAVMGVRLKGHGTSPWDLRERSWQEWLSSVRRGYEIMSLLAENVCIVGFSTGGCLALLAAAERPARLAGVVAISPALRLRKRNLALVPVIHGINRLTEWAYAEEGLMPFRLWDPETPSVTYRHVPIRGLFELRRLGDEVERRLGEIQCPVAILQGREDPIVDPASATLVHDRIGSGDKSMQIIDSQRHGILQDNSGDSHIFVLSHIDRWGASGEQESSVIEAIEPVRLPGTIETSVTATPRQQGKINGTLPRSLKRLVRPFRRRRAGAVEAREPAKPPWEASYPNGTRWDAAIEPKPLPQLLDDAVATYADRICMSFRGKHYKYREVGRLVDRAAKGLQDLGVDKGVKVGLLLPNCPYAVICFHAVLKAGGTVVNVNPLYSAGEIERQIADSGCRILVTLDVKGLYEKAARLIREDGQIENLIVCRMKGALRFTEKVAFGFLKGSEVVSVAEDERHIFFERLIANEGGARRPEIDPLRDVAVLQYTGGTTGFSKGAQLTHANLYTNAAQLALWAPQARRGEEKMVAALPLFHSFGMSAVMNLSILIGAEMILLARFQTAEVLKTISRERATIFIGVPTMYSALISSREIAKSDLSNLRICISGGAALAGDIQMRFEQLSGCRLVEGYGLSEASPVCTINPLDGGKPGSVGLPLPQTTIEIVAIENPERLLGLEERGEICVRGPQVMLGYANRAKENIDVFRGGRLHTGDIGYLDEDGYLYIVDRIKDLIISGGFNVYPRQVEEVIHQHPSVEEVAVCGVQDQHRGEVVKAFVRLREGKSLTAAELRDFCKDKLAPFQMPRQIEFRESLPKTLIGKISKRELLAEALVGNHQPDAA